MTNFIKIKKIPHRVLEFDLKRKLTTLLILVSLSQIQAHVKNVSSLTLQGIAQQQLVRFQLEN